MFGSSKSSSSKGSSGSSSSSADPSSALFGRYKQQLRKEHRTGGGASATASPASVRSSSNSVLNTPQRPPSSLRTSASGRGDPSFFSMPSNAGSPLQLGFEEPPMLVSSPYAHGTPNGYANSNHSRSATPAVDGIGSSSGGPGGVGPRGRPSSSLSRSSSASSAGHTSAHNARAGAAEINARWKAIFGELERWSADESQYVAPAEPITPKGTYATIRVPCSLKTAAMAQKAYERALDRHAIVLEQHAIQVSQWHKLADAAHAQAEAGGPRNGERRLMVPPSVGPPPSPPPPVPASPYAPGLQRPEDVAWRAHLAAHPETLRPDALDYRALESRLTEFLCREGAPLTRVKEAFVANFLDAYSAARNPSLRSHTTSQASDLLLSNTLPTLLHFLDLLSGVLMRLWVELDPQRNRDVAESIRQACMESVFPSIFPALFALYRRKYYFRDAELSAKMAVLASTGAQGCNIRLADLGVSKWFQLDESVVAAERAAAKQKRRAKERERLRQEHGETELQAQARERREDERAAAAERAAADAFDRHQLLQEQQLQQQADSETASVAAALAAAAPGTAATAAAAATSSSSSSALVSPQPVQRSGLSLALTPFNNAHKQEQAEASSAAPAGPHPIAALTGSRSGGLDGDDIIVPPSTGAISIGSGLKIHATRGSDANGSGPHSPATGGTGGGQFFSSKNTSPFRPGSASSGARAIPTTRLGSPSASISIGGAGGAGAGDSGVGGGGGATMPMMMMHTAKSLSSSPRAERLQDVFLSMSPARRGLNVPQQLLAAAAGGASATGSGNPSISSSLSKSVARASMVPFQNASAAAAGVAAAADSVGAPTQPLSGSSRAPSPSSASAAASSPATDLVAVRFGPATDGVSISVQIVSLSASSEVQSLAPPPDVVITPSTPDSSDKRTQVGFTASGVGVTLAPVPVPTPTPTPPPPKTPSPSPAGLLAAGLLSAGTTPAPNATPTTSSLGLALQQRRNAASAVPSPVIGVGASSSAAPSSTPAANTAGVSTPPKSSKPSKLGFGNNSIGASGGQNIDIPRYRGDDSSDDDDDSDASSSAAADERGGMRMPGLDNMPKLGSSMPMLMGLPSSMLTHTPGKGSELLKQEQMQRKRGLGALSPDAQMMNGGGGGMPINNVSNAAMPAPYQHTRNNSFVPQQPQLQQQQSHHVQSFSVQSNSSGLSSEFVSPSPITPATASAATPSTFGVGAHSEIGLDTGLGDDDEEEEAFPYQEAVVLLRQLSSERTPRDKLQCLIAVSQEICWCVDSFYARACYARSGWRPRPEELCINADDLLSLVSFILVKSRVSYLFSEAAFIDDFISKSMKVQMPGYFLATLQAAIELISKIDKSKFVSRELQEQEQRDKDADKAAKAAAAAAALTNSKRGAVGGKSTEIPASGLSTPRNAQQQSNGVVVSQGSSSAPRETTSHQPQQQPHPPLSARRGAAGQTVTPFNAVGSLPRGNGVLHAAPMQQQHNHSSTAPSSRAMQAGSVHSRAQSAQVSSSSSGSVGSSDSGMRVSLGSTSAAVAAALEDNGTPLSSSVASHGPSSLLRTSSRTLSHGHSTVTHSSPTSRLEGAEPEARLSSEQQLHWQAAAFQLNLEHFSQPNTPLGGNSALSSRSPSFMGNPFSMGTGSMMMMGGAYIEEPASHMSSPAGGAASSALSPRSPQQPLLDPQRAAQAAALAAQHRAAVALVEKQRRERKAALAKQQASSMRPSASPLDDAIGSPQVRAASLASSRGVL